MVAENVMALIADCMKKAQSTENEDRIGEYLSEALADLQVEMSEEDAANMLEGAIASDKSEARRDRIFRVWQELQSRSSPGPGDR
jgi:diphthamide synthase (EF-2-diphthine--ammonia ligase)